MKRYAIILASGDGTRAGGGIPKQFRDLCGRPVFWWSMRAFQAADPDCSLIVVIHPGFIGEWPTFWDRIPAEQYVPHRLCCGGPTRPESVANGLAYVDAEEAVVAVHDAARPLVSPEVILRSFAVAEGCPGKQPAVAVPAIPLSDSLRHLEGGAGSVPVERGLFRAVQTPQTSRLSWLRNAYGQPLENPLFTDDASILQSAGYPVELIEGDPSNIKITTPPDFAIAEAFLKAQ